MIRWFMRTDVAADRILSLLRRFFPGIHEELIMSVWWSLYGDRLASTKHILIQFGEGCDEADYTEVGHTESLYTWLMCSRPH